MTTDTQAAVAAALMQAAEKAFNVIANYPLRTMLTNTDNATMMELAILALITPDAMAALEAVKAEARKAAFAEFRAIYRQFHGPQTNAPMPTIVRGAAYTTMDAALAAMEGGKP